jgi:hypothetical protein
MTNTEGSASIRSMIENDLPEVRILADQLGYAFGKRIQALFQLVSLSTQGHLYSP